MKKLLPITTNHFIPSALGPPTQTSWCWAAGRIWSHIVACLHGRPLTFPVRRGLRLCQGWPYKVVPQCPVPLDLTGSAYQGQRTPSPPCHSESRNLHLPSLPEVFCFQTGQPHLSHHPAGNYLLLHGARQGLSQCQRRLRGPG